MGFVVVLWWGVPIDLIVVLENSCLYLINWTFRSGSPNVSKG